MRALAIGIAVVFGSGLLACGDDGADVDVDAPSGDILEQLRGLEEVVSVTEQSTQHPGYRYFEIEFDQPVDHDNPSGPHFQQYATLIHKDVSAPFVLLHTGYGNWWYDYPSELTRILGANQIVVEHRFFRTSRPEGTAAWQYLTIEQSAADHHRISEALHRIYKGKWLETGASKGGMTSIYHRRFWPDDVDGTVAYVAPESFGAPDYRYEPFIEAIGTAACRQALRDFQAEMLRNRRAMLEARATSEAQAQGYSYTRVTLPVAVESAVVSVEWAFWQYVGAGECPSVPPVTATDAAAWSFLRQVSPVWSLSDDDIADLEAYYYQAEVQLGYPGTMDEHLTGLTMFGSADLEGTYPQGVTRPPWTVDAMNDVDGWVKGMGDSIVFIYGEWDPWSGGMYQLGSATDSLRVVAPMGAHGSGIGDLTPGDQTMVLTKLQAWTGVAPDLAQLKRRARLQEPTKRVPPMIQLRP